MELEIDIRRVFNQTEIERLEKLLNEDGANDLQDIMKNITLAALHEYKEMLIGRGIPSRADEIHQYRLFSLIKYYFGETLPSEEELSSLFQITPSKSKNLIRNVRIKFRYELEDQMKNTAQKVLRTAKPDQNGDFRVIIKSDYVLEEIKRYITQNAPNHENLTKYSGGARVYNIKGDTCKILCTKYGVDFNSLSVGNNE